MLREQLEHTELHLGEDDEQVESLQVRVKGWANVLILLCVCTPHQE